MFSMIWVCTDCLSLLRVIEQGEGQGYCRVSVSHGESTSVTEDADNHSEANIQLID